jgi:poly(A) polymerase
MTVHHSFLLPPEMSSPEIRKIFRALGEGSARFVGGCVRNALLGEEIGDIDLATSLTPQCVTERLNEKGIKSIPTGIQHGTVTAVINGKRYEITTLRIDKKTDGRRAEVEFSTDWVEDARRRDFTINTLYADLDGRIHDPLGCGLADLEKRKVRFVGEANARIREDYLRILRFIRFSARYGRGKFDTVGLEACCQNKRGLKTLSKERVTQELSKIVTGVGASRGVEVLWSSGLLGGFFSRDFEISSFKKLLAVQSDSGEALVVARLALMCGASVSGLNRMSNLLILNRFWKKLLIWLVSKKINTIRIDLADVREMAINDGRDFTLCLLDLLYALGRLTRSEHQEFVMSGCLADTPAFPVGGHDMRLLGIEGEAIGFELGRLKRLWIESDFALSRSQLLDLERYKLYKL